MSLEELWELFPIILKNHNPDYTIWYREEKDNLVQALSAYDVCRISHIGSTAVEGLISKPIVDILLEFPDNYRMLEIVETLKNNKWLVMAQNEKKKTLDLNKGYTLKGFAEKVFHLHIKPEDDWGELYFRDYLQKYPDIARQYELLKLELKTQYKHDRDAYTNAKSDFVLKYTEIAKKEFVGRYLPIKS